MDPGLIIFLGHLIYSIIEINAYTVWPKNMINPGFIKL